MKRIVMCQRVRQSSAPDGHATLFSGPRRWIYGTVRAYVRGKVLVQWDDGRASTVLDPALLELVTLENYK